MNFQNSFRKGHHISFKYAFEGLKFAFDSQPNLKIHTFIGFWTIIGGFFLKFTQPEWLVLILIITVVFVTEMFNTAMENAIDCVTKEWKQEAKWAKDVTAGAVLCAAIGAIVLGLLLFIPHLAKLL